MENLSATPPSAPVPATSGLTTDRAAGIIAIGCLVFLAVVRRAFGGVLHP